MATIIIKNNTSVSKMIGDLGIEIAGNSNINLTNLFEDDDIIASDDLKSYVSAGLLIVNSGTQDLSIENGLAHLTKLTKYEDKSTETGGEGTNIRFVQVVSPNSFNLNNTTETKITWTSANFLDSEFSFTNNASSIYTNIGGIFLISYNICWYNSNSWSTKTIKSYVKLNNSTTILGSESHVSSYITLSGTVYVNNSKSFICSLSQNDYVELCGIRVDNSGTITSVPTSTSMAIKLLRES